MDYQTSIVLDTRRAKGKGLYPVKLRVYSAQLQIKKLYGTKYDLSEKDFKSIWETNKPRNEHKELRNILQTIELKADNICKTLSPFSFEQFEKKFLRNSGDGSNIIYQYNEVIRKLSENKGVNTASNYELSLKSIKGFIMYVKGKLPEKIPFNVITPDWLQKYEDYMINDLKRSRTKVSMYLRALRTIFNIAIREKEIDADLYPFGKDKYQPPTVSNVKKALTKDDLSKLFKSVPRTKEQEKAKDFWFFSFACNGLNIKDIALLTWKNLQDEKLILYRAKTINTSKTNLKPITVYLNDFARSIIKKYGNPKVGKDDFIFPIIQKDDSDIIKHKKIKNFTRFINQNLKKLAAIEGITSDISTYWARHSFATNAIRAGQSMEFVMEALNHHNLKTTAVYFAGFEDEAKKEFMENLMNF